MRQIKTEDFIKYEDSEMTPEEETTFIQTLIDTGMAWTLQGHYGRTARRFIEEGRCTKAGRGRSDASPSEGSSGKT